MSSGCEHIRAQYMFIHVISCHSVPCHVMPCNAKQRKVMQCHVCGCCVCTLCTHAVYVCCACCVCMWMLCVCCVYAVCVAVGACVAVLFFCMHGLGRHLHVHIVLNIIVCCVSNVFNTMVGLFPHWSSCSIKLLDVHSNC